MDLAQIVSIGVSSKNPSGKDYDSYVRSNVSGNEHGAGSAMEKQWCQKLVDLFGTRHAFSIRWLIVVQYE